MGTKVPANTVKIVTGDAAITTQAQNAYKGVIKRLLDSAADVTTARDAATAAGEQAQGIRVILLTELAKASADNGWQHNLAMQGIASAIEAYEKTANDPSSVRTLNQFKTECSRAIHPEARAHVKRDFERATKLWEAEDAAVAKAKAAAVAAGERFSRADVDTPLHDTFKRKYHFVIGSTGLAAARATKGRKEGDISALVDKPTELAEHVAGKERANSGRAKRMLNDVIAKLREINEEFPHQQWRTMLNFMEDISADDLVRMRDRHQRQQRNASDLRKPRKNTQVIVEDDDDESVGDAADELLDS